MQAFKHRRIIKFHGTFVHQSYIYSVMDFASGGELEALLKEKGALPENKVKVYFKQIRDAVAYIHGRNVVHRDLKPANLLFTNEDKTDLVLIDFGISGISSGNIHEKVNAGTVMYIPPELVAGNYSSDAGLDTWAMGVILFRMLFGEFPFWDKSESKLMDKIISQPLTFPKDVVVSKKARILVERLLDKQKKTRIQANDPFFDDWFRDSCLFKQREQRRSR